MHEVIGNIKNELISSILETQQMFTALNKFGIEDQETVNLLMEKRESAINELAATLSEQEIDDLAEGFKKKNNSLPADFDSRRRYYAARILIKITEEGNKLFGV